MEISNKKDLKIKILENGSVGAITYGSLLINLRHQSIHTCSGTQLYLRVHGERLHLQPLMGPELKGGFGIADNKFYAKTESGHLKVLTELKLSAYETAWMWSVMINNTSHKEEHVDVIFIQDVGLRKATKPVNEYYVSQYIERRMLDDDLFGKVGICRQNMVEAESNPWLLMACPEGAIAGATDGAQIFGPENRAAKYPPGLLKPQLGGEYAGESSLLALQSKTLHLKPGSGTVLRFMFLFMPNHPEPTSDADLARIRPVLGSFEAFNPLPYLPWKQMPHPSIFNLPNYAQASELTEEEISKYFGNSWLHAERVDGKLLSFFTSEGNHVVLMRKELLVDRPHGHIIRSGTRVLPDERMMSTNPFMAGIFLAHTTSGNTNFNVLHSIYANQFGQSSPTGQRVFVKQHARWYLLGVPSAFEMGFNFCRWIYRLDNLVLEAVTWTSLKAHQVNFRLRVISGGPTDFRVTNHFDASAEFSIQMGNKLDALVYPSEQSLMGKQFPAARFAVMTGPYTGLVEAEIIRFNDEEMLVHNFMGSNMFQLSYACFYHDENVSQAEADFGQDALSANTAFIGFASGLELKSQNINALIINTILPWFGTNALTHYLTPYGLEQFGGAAWGTRDVSQGPIELLLSLGRYAEARKILITIFKNQHPDGGWPQWWMFDSYTYIRAHEAHGDITYWVMLALANYLLQTNDNTLLDEELPYFDPSVNQFISPEPVIAHVKRWLHMITSSFIPGTTLVPFGGGDWNDSLQPASKLFAERLISSWTVQMCYQAFSQLAAALVYSEYTDLAGQLLNLSAQVHSDFHKHLVKDDVVAGYGKLEDDGSISLLLHPRDQLTGIKYSILPMNRGVLSHIFSPELASQHMQLIREHLKGPDGARLMDKPLQYSGGTMRIFQRAETSTYFGREIGLMYVHEHIRHAEALSVLGLADEFVLALRQAIPVHYDQVVPNAAPRQSNCYYSSSDIIFPNRYEADRNYHLVKSGQFTFRGGWRIYSSGPGILVSLVITRLLGIRRKHNQLIIDPVMPRSFDGLEAEFEILGKPVCLRYHVKENVHSPYHLMLNGRQLTFARERQAYRTGGAILANDGLQSVLNNDKNVIDIYL